MLAPLEPPRPHPLLPTPLQVRWNNKKVKFREHTFLQNPLVPAALRDNRVRVTVAARGEAPAPSSAHAVHLSYGTPMAEVRAAVFAANPSARVVEIEAPHLKRLCRWLGSEEKQKAFNRLQRCVRAASALPSLCDRGPGALARYILTESSRYCPNEDHGGYGAPGFNWRNPFTAYNCTWGFHYPNTYPETQACGEGGAGVEMVERDNSTTCPRQMLCDFNTRPDGIETAKITRCNIEGYGGMDPQFKAATQWMLSQMPGGRCPYPPGDRPGILGFDKRGHYVGPQT